VVSPRTPDPKAGGAGLTYLLWQTLGTVQRLTDPHPEDSNRLKNALLESALIDLRAMAGVLKTSPRRSVGKDNRDDVLPTWFEPTDGWLPHHLVTPITQIFDAVSGAVAHLAIKSPEHPGDWPEREALLVVTLGLEALYNAASDTGKDHLRDEHRTLPQVIGEVRSARFEPYESRPAAPNVADLRAVLRTVLPGWDGGT